MKTQPIKQLTFPQIREQKRLPELISKIKKSNSYKLQLSSISIPSSKLVTSYFLALRYCEICSFKEGSSSKINIFIFSFCILV